MVLTARGEAAWITRREMARTARGETRDGDRRGNAATGNNCAAALHGRAPRGAISISGPLGSVPGRASIFLVFPWVGREAMALSFVVNYKLLIGHGAIHHTPGRGFLSRGHAHLLYKKAVGGFVSLI